ncbi:MAG: FAD/NAD(P)-binding protein [Thermoplasmatales archaeon]
MITQENEYIPRYVDVIAKRDETSDVFSIVLNTRSTAKPGQFFMLSVPGVGEAAISAASGPGRQLEFTIRKVGKVTSSISKANTIGIRGPYGNHWPVDDFDHVLAVAGGIGIPPIRSLIEDVTDRGRGSSLEVLYGARSPDDIVYASMIEEWHKVVNVKLTVDRGNPSWRGNVGFVTSLIPGASSPRSAAVFIVGPPLMMKNAVDTLLKTGFRKDRIYLSLERRMECGIGVCGHCNIGKYYVCESGPIFRFTDVEGEPELFL